MNEPPTMIIRELDDERTLVDPRFSPLGERRDKSAAGERSKQEKQPTWRDARSFLSSRRRQIVEAGLALAVLLGLGSVAYQQWRVVEALHRAIADMKSPLHATLTPPSVHSQPGQEAPLREERHSKASVEEVGAEERHALERRAATLVASNDFRSALTQYQRLVELFPTVEAFRDIVTVLRAKLGCDRADLPAGGACP